MIKGAKEQVWEALLRCHTPDQGGADMIVRTMITRQLQVLPGEQVLEQEGVAEELSLRVLSGNAMLLLSGNAGDGLKLATHRLQHRSSTVVSSDEKIRFRGQWECGKDHRESYQKLENRFFEEALALGTMLGPSQLSVTVSQRFSEVLYLNSLGAFCRRYEHRLELEGHGYRGTGTRKRNFEFHVPLDSLVLGQELMSTILPLGSDQGHSKQSFDFEPHLPLAFSLDILEWIVAPIIQSCSGENNSPLDSQITHPSLGLVLKPRVSPGPNETAFDDEGYPTGDLTIIEKGRRCARYHNSVTAIRHGLPEPSTGHAWRGLTHALRTDFGFADVTMQDGSRSAPPQYLVIREIRTRHRSLNSETGDFAFVASGEFHGDGQPALGIDDVLVSGNCFEMMRNLVGSWGPSRVSSSGRLRAPFLFFENLHVLSGR